MMGNIKWHTEKRKLSELKPMKGNPRQATEKQTKDLKQSLDKFNLASPLIINTDNTIIGGHFRFNVLSEDNHKEVDVRIPDRRLTSKEVIDLLEDVGFNEKELAIFNDENEEGIFPKSFIDPETYQLKNIKINKDTKHIVSLSGGKDSTALILGMIEKKMQIDEIIHIQTDDWDWEAQKKHIKKMIDNGIKITVVEPEISMTDVLKKKGFPNQFQRWCNNVKIKTIKQYLKKKYPSGNILHYIGIAFNEKERVLSSKQHNAYFPLIDWKMTEEQALEYCYQKGYDWEGHYKKYPGKRLSCWCCPFQTLEDLRWLKKNHPNKWNRLREMQSMSRQSFRLNYMTIFKLDHKFWLEDFNLKEEKK